MKRVLILIAAVAMLVVSIPMAGASANGDFGDPDKVWVCHFAGHEAGGVFYVSPTEGPLNGDYIVTLKSGESGPTARQATFCTDAGHQAKLIPVAGELILVSVNAVNKATKGHRVQNLDRGIASYPNGYRG